MALGMAAVGIGVLDGRSGELAAATGTTAAGVSTPIVSARRVPMLLGRSTALRRLRTAVEPLLAKAPANHCVAMAEGGQQLIDSRGSEALMPGSNAKLLTANAMLSEIGADTTFETTFIAESALGSDGAIGSNLWMVGGGDPLITTDPYRQTNKYGPDVQHTSLEAIADTLVAAGLKRVGGSVVGDESRYDTERTVASWPDRYLAEAQVGPLTALSVNDARTYPAIAGQSSGTPQPSKDPAAYAADALTQLLRQRGVEVVGEAAAGQSPSGGTKLASVASLPVRDIVREMLSYSDNNTAELMLKELGHRAGVQPGNTAAGIAVVADVLSQQSIPVEGMVVVDGSGLDRGTRVSCATLQSVLAAAGPSGDLANGLAVAATSGTLEDRYRRSPAAGKVRAKTGTLRDVTALSGWVVTDPGRNVTFSILFNLDDRQVSDSDLLLTQRMTEAALSYPDSPDLSALVPAP